MAPSMDLDASNQPQLALADSGEPLRSRQGDSSYTGEMSADGESDMELQREKTRTNEMEKLAQDADGLGRVRTNRTHKSEVIEVGALHPETDLSRNIVGWEGQDDPENPRNFPMRRKIFVLSLVSAITFLSPLASSMFAPGVVYMDQDFHVTSTILTSFVVSVYVLGWAFGPLIISPLSEIYGRRRVLDVGNIMFVVWQIGCALAPNVGSLIAFRFLAGLGGSACLTVGGGIISDLFAPDQRGLATSLFSLGPLFGPVIGPITGGFLAQRTSWRWVFWVLLIAGGCCTVFIFFFGSETNPQVLIARKVKKLQKETGNQELISWYEKDKKARTQGEILKTGLVRPMKMLLFSPIVAMLASYMAFVYGILYLLFTTITLVFEEHYHWQPEFTGLAYIGIGVGFFCGVIATAKLSDATVVKLSARNNGIAEPEFRLPACAFFSIFMPISLFWYGWCADKHTHWIVPIIALMPFGFGMMGIFVPIQTYMIDAFPNHAASAIAALTATRSVVGAFLPMAGPSMYSKLGLGWGNSLLGFLSLGIGAPIWLIYKYGGNIRKNHPVILD